MSKDREQNKWMGMAWIAIAIALAAVLMVGAFAVLGQRGGETTGAVVQGFPTSSTRHVFQDGAITDTNGAAMDVRFYPALGIQVEGITDATVEFECTVDRSNWNDVQLVNVETGAVVTSTTSDGVFAGMVGGLEQVRCPVSGYGSGTITVTGSASTGSGRELADVDVAGTEDVTVSDITTGTIDVGVISSALPAGTNNIGDVDVLTIAAGETHIGEVGTESDVISVTLTLDTSQYASGDVLADTQALTDVMRVSAGTGVIYSIVVLDNDDQGQALDIVILDTNCSLGTENSAVSIADSCADDILCVVEIGAADYVDLVNSQIVMASPACIVEAGAGIDELWFGVISRGTGTYTANGVILQMGLLLD